MKMDGSNVVMKLEDGRTLRLSRSGKTKLYRQSKEIKPSEFGPGDQVSADATEDQWGMLFALRVDLDRTATPEERQQAIAESTQRPPARPESEDANDDARPTLKRKDGPSEAKHTSDSISKRADSRDSASTSSSDDEQSAASKPASTVADNNPPEPSNPGYGEDQPPALRRGKSTAPSSTRPDPPARTQTPIQTEPPVQPETQPETPARPVPALRAPVRTVDRPNPVDALVERAREATFSFANKLPNFLCEEFMARFQRFTNAQGWQSLDVIAAEIIYENGQESYRNLKINGAPTKKKMEELSGAWSTGEFATTLNDLLHPQTDARFRDGGETKINGQRARVYDFDVEQRNSHWNVQTGSQSLAPAYQGSVWIDPETARALRVEIQAKNLPSDFPMDVVESAVDYSWVRIAGDSVLMPVHAESLGCQRGTHACSRNVIDFRNYRKYSSDTKIIFGDEGGDQTQEQK
jgi:hypothetical protein